MRLLHDNMSNVYLSYFNMFELDPAQPSGILTPAYIDLGIKSGLTVSTNGILGSQANFSVTIKNYGDFNAHVNSFLIWLRDPSGANIDGMTGGMQSHPMQIAPTEEIIISGQCPNVGTIPGDYAAGACYLSKQGRWVNIPAMEPGTVKQVVFSLRQVINELVVTNVLNNTGNQFELTFSVSDTLGNPVQNYQVTSAQGAVLGGSNASVIIDASCTTTTTTKRSTKYTIEKDLRGKPHRVYETLTCTNRFCTPAFQDFVIQANGYQDKVIRVNFNATNCI
ncbi:MAG: hypothetical protein ABI707_01880 [Ferruginibacter sp.]